MRTTALVIGAGIAGLTLAGCGGGTKSADTTTDTTTIITQTVMPTSSAASAAPSAFPQPPAGATQIKTDTESGASRGKYTINDQSPNQVMEYYTNLWRNDGYTIITSGGGGDAGRGGGAGAVASKNGVFVAVEAGADAGEPTHFDVCQGSDERAVRDCVD